MSEKQSKQQLEQCKAYNIKNQKFTEITPKKKWSFIARDEKLTLYDGGLFYNEFNREIVRIKYRQSQAFFSKSGSGYFVLVLALDSELNDVIEYKFQEFKIVLMGWDEANRKMQEDIRQCCGQDIDEKFNTKTEGKKSLGYKIGGFFGAINGLVAKPTKKINEATSEKVSKITDEKVSEETKSNWKKVTDKAKEINHEAGELMKPAKEKLSGLTDKIGEKFNKSENSLIRGLRNFGNSLKDSLNEGYRNSHQGPQETKETQSQHPKVQLNVIDSERNME